VLFNIFKTANINGIDEWYLFVEDSKFPVEPIVVSTNYYDIQKKIFELIENSTKKHNAKEKVTLLSSNNNNVCLLYTSPSPRD